jgi:hypothetical protein
MQLITSLVLAGALAASPAHGPVIPPDPWAVSAAMPSSQLNSVFCLSADDCWSVGYTITKPGDDRNQVLHWTGKRWFSVTVPNQGGTGKGDSSQLGAVRCTSASDCWAVGQYWTSENSARFDQALHWNGKTWRVIGTPTPGGRLPGSLNELDDVSCISPDNCWAIGFYGEDVATSKSEFEIGLNQALHWNGKSWSLVPVPSPAGSGKNHVSVLDSIRCASASSCWAAGAFGNVGKLTVRDQVLRWNGKKWTRVAVPDPAGVAPGDLNELVGLSCTAVSNCWAVGLYGKLTAGPTMPSSLNLVLHWNGRKWSKVSVLSPGPNGGKFDQLNAVTCDGAKDCWAVGQAGNLDGNQPVRNTALHWNGVKWSLGTTPNPAGTGSLDRSELNSVRCVSAADCWAVGVEVHNGRHNTNQILHWTGKKWFVG